MPYKCVHCSQLYGDGSEEVLKGCSNCGKRFFFYGRKDQLEKINLSSDVELGSLDKKQIARYLDEE